MSLVIPCPGCACPCKVPDSAAGTKVKCPRCGSPFAVPASNAVVSPQPINKVKPAPSPVTEPSAAAVSAPKRSSAGPLLVIGCAALVALAGAAGGGGLLVWFLLPRPPASPQNDGGPSASADSDTKQTPRGPAVDDAKAKQELQAARRQSQKNLKQLAFAFNAYNDTYAQCPPAMVMGWPRNPPPGNQRPRPQPLLSWRVLILPFLEENQLYLQFKLDEPWDSPHNKKLLAKMPKVYAPVRGSTTEPGMTYYQVFVGPKTPFWPAEMLPVPQPGAFAVPQGGPRIPASFPDGTSQTLLIAEGSEPVPWTKPADLEYDEKKPVPKLGGLFADGFHAAVFSTEVYFIPRDFKEKDLRRMIVPNDFEVLESDIRPLLVKDETQSAANPSEKGDVRGTVTFKGVPLMGGNVSFVGNRMHSSPIAPDGSYSLRDVPAGVYKISVAPMPKGAATGGDKMPGPPGFPPKGGRLGRPPKSGQMAIPDKYRNPDTSGLQFRVEKGANTLDVQLE